MNTRPAHSMNPSSSTPHPRTSSQIISSSELDILRQHHRFLFPEDEDQDPSLDPAHPTITDTDTDTDNAEWERRIAKKYYDKLFKEFCLADLSKYKVGRIAMRWRSKQEVLAGKGQSKCGSIHCDSILELHSWEVNFAYLEHGVRKNALVKLTLCPSCSHKLHYKRQTTDAVDSQNDSSHRKPKRHQASKDHVDDSNTNKKTKTTNKHKVQS